MALFYCNHYFIVCFGVIRDCGWNTNSITHLVFNLWRRSFGHLQVLQQVSVSEEVSRHSGEAWEQVVLQSFQSDSEAVLVRFDYKVKDRERHVCADLWWLIKTRATGQSQYLQESLHGLTDFLSPKTSKTASVMGLSMLMDPFPTSNAHERRSGLQKAVKSHRHAQRAVLSYWPVKTQYIPEEVNLHRNKPVIASLRQWPLEPFMRLLQITALELGSKIRTFPCDGSSERRKTGTLNHPVLMSQSLMITFPLASCASNYPGAEKQTINQQLSALLWRKLVHLQFQPSNYAAESEVGEDDLRRAEFSCSLARRMRLSADHSGIYLI